MILPFLAGFFVSFLAIFSFLKINYVSSINKWILQTSQFIYYSGHPLLDDDEIFKQITGRFKGVFSSLMIVLFKTIVFLTIILLIVSLSSIIIYVFHGNSLSASNDTFLSILFPKYLIRLPFIIGSLLPIFLLPYFNNKERKESEAYSSIDKLLHYVFLGNKNIAQFLFKIELFLNKKLLKNTTSNKNVYVSGLARAGTTVLMQYLGQLEDFKSISYRNLPFLFLPKTWSKSQNRKNLKEKERFHQDGIMHNINSYEALEESFWRIFIGSFIKDDTIVRHDIDKNIFKKYNYFRRLIAGNKIYLAKNNNHLLRAESLHQLDKKTGNNTLTIIPFRNPYNQAQSLLNQHLLLSKLQKDDEFTLDYMDFLVHHEFGLHSKIPLLKEADISFITKIDKNSIEYWLEIWLLFYNSAYELFKDKHNIYFICYEDFIIDPKRSLKLLLELLNLPKNRIDKIIIKDFKPRKKIELEDKGGKYLDLYYKLNQIAINNYG